MNRVNHLYIHIPFCNSICWYCDFKRSVCNNQQIKIKYVDDLVSQISTKYKDSKFKTIYIGGGTPNSLHELLIPLLKELSNHLQDEYEFTIECNPECINDEQLKIFKTYKINRISLGVQSTNDNLLNKIGRKHKTDQVIKAIELLKSNGFNNYSIDLIYGFNEQTLDDIYEDFEFIQKYNIPHVSWYSLEVKNNSAFGKLNYQLDEQKAEDMLKVIESMFEKLGYERYEVSNWCVNSKYESQHNLAYWNTYDWIGLGYGAFGLEQKNYYENIGQITSYKQKSYSLSNKEYYQQIWIMGLRTKYGLNLNNDIHKQAYEYFKNKVNPKNLKISKSNIQAKNLNTIDNILIEII